jgi:hypothetical protein
MNIPTSSLSNAFSISSPTSYDSISYNVSWMKNNILQSCKGSNQPLAGFFLHQGQLPDIKNN